jgi:hypothetical protein
MLMTTRSYHEMRPPQAARLVANGRLAAFGPLPLPPLGRRDSGDVAICRLAANGLLGWMHLQGEGRLTGRMLGGWVKGIGEALGGGNSMSEAMSAPTLPLGRLVTAVTAPGDCCG